jgi:serine/threonine-protein kinase
MKINITMDLIVRVAKYLLCFVLVSSLSGYITFKVLSSILTVEVPDVTDRSVQEAKESLESIGLTLTVGSEEFDLGVPEGHVITQDILPGSGIRGHGIVNVVVSKGPEVHLIPSMIGETLKSAKKIFRKERLALEKTIMVHSDEVRKGRIIAQRPAPEEWTGQSITLVASAGPYNVIYYCPFFQGMLKDDALMLASELDLDVKLGGSSEDAQIVVEQRPQPGAEIKMGDTLHLTLGRP